MTHMNEYLPERLAANPLQAMESDSDIEAIADAVISASVLRDECDGDAAFKNSARQLLYACLGYLRDWCSYEQRTVGNLKALLKLRPPPLAGVLRIPEAYRILVLADFLKVVILHLTALLFVLFLAAHIRFLSLGCLWLNYINLPCYQCSKLHSYTPSPQSRPRREHGS